jgi:hypothetical protein
MEKISSIVSSKSNSKVDMSKERPVRAGAPSYGQPVSTASHTFEKIKKEEDLMTPMEAVQSLKAINPEETRHLGIVDKITLSFRGSSEKPEPVIEKVIDVDALAGEEGASSESTEAPQSIDVYA